jgi:hypothetical protein
LDKIVLDEQFPRVNEIFSSETKRMTTPMSHPTAPVAYAKELLRLFWFLYATDGRDGQHSHYSDEELYSRCCQADGNDALRVLAIAWKPDARIESAESGMIFLGLAG